MTNVGPVGPLPPAYRTEEFPTSLEHRPVWQSSISNALYVPLPRGLWRSCGPCGCSNCCGKEGFWDTLVISYETTWTCHAPELHAPVAQVGPYTRRRIGR